MPVQSDLLSPWPNVSGSIEQKENTGRIRFGSQGINRREPVPSETVGPMIDLGMMAALSAGVMVIDDQAASGARQFL